MKRLRVAFWIVAGLALVALVVRAFRPVPVLVDVGEVRRGTLTVTVDDDGRTRVRERYTISAPIQGRLLRTPLEAGDLVRAGETVVAEFAPVEAGLLDERARAEARARIDRAESQLRSAQARRQQAEAEQRFAAAELERVRDLHRRDVRSRGELERAERDEARACEGLRAEEFQVQVARYEVELARASLLEPGDGEPPRGDAVDRAADGRLRLRAPIAGVVLRVLEESARTLQAGTAILELGNTEALEIVADYLSQDAVRIRPGMDVLIEGWGGDAEPGRVAELRGRVRVVEPGGFTKISALGVEEQRVNVIVDPVGDPAAWSALGDGYRVELRVRLWEEDGVLIVPTGALFRSGGAWAVYRVEAGAARLRAVEIGRRNGLQAQVLGGLTEGDRVVLYPSDLLSDGSPVEPR